MSDITSTSAVQGKVKPWSEMTVRERKSFRKAMKKAPNQLQKAGWRTLHQQVMDMPTYQTKACIDARRAAADVAQELDAELARLREENANEIAFNEGWQEHISDLLDAMKPFVRLVKETDGRIPTERLSFANWHGLTKAFDAAVSALNATQCKYPLGCDCPDCIKRFGPIHPANVGKDIHAASRETPDRTRLT